MRVAWIGGARDGGGVGGFARDLLRGLVATEGVDLTVFTRAEKDQIRALLLGEQPGEVSGEAEAGIGTKPEAGTGVKHRAGRLRVVSCRPRWQWGRWYSRHSLGVFLSSLWARQRAHRRLVEQVVAAHREQAFDVVLQFSQIELFGLRKHLKTLPPVLLFPCVHAAGELRWHRAEGRYARRSEPGWRHWVVRANLMHRTWLQGRDTRAVAGVLGMSKRFNELIAQDYGVEPARQAVVYQPMTVAEQAGDVAASASASELRASGTSETAGAGERMVRLLFVGRIAVRKGVEMLVDLSHRLDDLAGQVEMKVIGGSSFWSDYSKHLGELNPRVAQWLGAQPHAEVVAHMASADVLLVPSHYEPGGIVVAEALARGCAVAVTDEVGSAEPVGGPACRKFAAGDMDGFEAVVRQLVVELQAPPAAATLRASARAEAMRCFDHANARTKLLAILRQAIAGKAIGEVDHQWPAKGSIGSVGTHQDDGIKSVVKTT